MSDFDLQGKMQKTIEHMLGEYHGIRTGRASPGLLDSVKVNYYGAETPLKQLATVTTPEPRMMVVTPYDKSSVKAVEKAILAANIGLTPAVDGGTIRLVMPELTGERRKEFVKTAAKLAEDAKVALRGIRRDANDFYKKAEDASEITEDDLKDELEKVQKDTDKFITRVDEEFKKKEKEILEKI